MASYDWLDAKLGVESKPLGGASVLGHPSPAEDETGVLAGLYPLPNLARRRELLGIAPPARPQPPPEPAAPTPDPAFSWGEPQWVEPAEEERPPDVEGPPEQGRMARALNVFWRSAGPQNVRMAGEAAEGVGVLTGSEGLEGVGDRLRKAAEEWGAGQDPTFEGLADLWERSEGVGETLDNALTFAAEGVAQGLGSFVPMVGGGVIGAAAGRAAGPMGAKVGAAGGALAGSAVLNFGESYGQFKEELGKYREELDDTEAKKEAARWAAAITPLLAGLDLLGLGGAMTGGKQAADAVKRAFVDRVIKEVAPQIASGALRGMASEGITETLQSLSREVTASGITGTGQDEGVWLERAERIATEGVIGGLTGGVVGAGAGATRSLGPQAEPVEDVPAADPGAIGPQPAPDAAAAMLPEDAPPPSPVDSGAAVMPSPDPMGADPAFELAEPQAVAPGPEEAPAGPLGPEEPVGPQLPEEPLPGEVYQGRPDEEGLKPGDRESPIPTSAIKSGRAAMDELIEEGDESARLIEMGAPPVGTVLDDPDGPVRVIGSGVEDLGGEDVDMVLVQREGEDPQWMTVEDVAAMPTLEEADGQREEAGKAQADQEKEQEKQAKEEEKAEADRVKEERDLELAREDMDAEVEALEAATTPEEGRAVLDEMMGDNERETMDAATTAHVTKRMKARRTRIEARKKREEAAAVEKEKAEAKPEAKPKAKPKVKPKPAPEPAKGAQAPQPAPAPPSPVTEDAPVAPEAAPEPTKLSSGQQGYINRRRSAIAKDVGEEEAARIVDEAMADGADYETVKSRLNAAGPGTTAADMRELVKPPVPTEEQKATWAAMPPQPEIPDRAVPADIGVRETPSPVTEPAAVTAEPEEPPTPQRGAWEGLVEETKTPGPLKRKAKAVRETLGEEMGDAVLEQSAKGGDAAGAVKALDAVSRAAKAVGEGARVGEERTAKTPDRSQTVKLRSVVVPAATLRPSHDAEGTPLAGPSLVLQPRKREQATSVEQVQTIARDPDFEFLGETPTTDDGAPVLGPDGAVESGNGRVAGLKKAYSGGGKAARGYRQAVISWAKEKGVDVSGMKDPVLVRVRTDEKDTAERRAFIRASNVPRVATTGVTETAKADAEAWFEDPASLSLFAPSESGDVLAATNDRFLQSVYSKVPVAQRSGLNVDGKWTRAFAERVEAAVLQRAYGDERIVREAKEAAVPDGKRLISALGTASASWAKMDEAARAKGVPIVAEAVQILAEARQKGGLETLLAQRGMFETTKRDSNAVKLARALDAVKTSGKKQTDLLTSLAKELGIWQDAEARRTGTSATADILGGIPKRTLNNVIDEVTEAAKPAPPPRPGAGLFTASGRATREADKTRKDEEPKKQERRPELRRRQGRPLPPAAVKKIQALGKRLFGDSFNIEAAPAGETASEYDAARNLATIVMEGDAVESLGHEGMHHLRNIGAFSDADEAALRREWPKWRKRFGIDQAYPELTDTAKNYEAEAEAFGRYAQRGMKGLPGVPAAVVRVFRAIGRFLRGMRRTLMGAGYRSAADVFEDVEAGRYGEERQTAPGVSRQTAKDIRRGETEADPGARHVAIGERVVEVAGELAEGFSSAHPGLPRDQRFSLAHAMLRQLRGEREVASARVLREMMAEVNGLSRRQVDLLAKVSAFRGLVEDKAAGRKIPFDAREGDLETQMAFLEEQLAKPQNEVVRKALETRKRHVKAYADEGVAAGVFTKEAVSREEYFRHQVLDFRAGRGPVVPAGMRRGKWARRRGTKRVISLEYVGVETEYRYRVLQSIAQRNIMAQLEASRYNKARDLRNAVAAHNEQALRAATAQSKEKQRIYREWAGRTAWSFSQLKKALTDGKVPRDRIPPQLRSAWDALMSGRDKADPRSRDEQTFNLLSWLNQNEQGPWSHWAGVSLGLVFSKRRIVKQIIGDAYIHPGNLDKAAEKLGGTRFEGYRSWQDDKGHYMTAATTFGEAMIRKLGGELADKADDIGVGSADVKGLVQDILDSGKEVLVRGALKPQVFIPAELAEALDALEAPKPERNMASDTLREATRVWKAWRLFNPATFARYTVQNISGDLDKALAAFSHVIQKEPVNSWGYVRASMRDLWGTVMHPEREPPDRVITAMRHGVIRGGWSDTELRDALGDLLDEASLQVAKRGPSKAIKRYWRAILRFNAFREDIFRYALYRALQDRTAAQREKAGGGASLLEITMKAGGFGAAPAEMVQGLQEDDVRNALVARETIGDYGAISKYGDEMRQHVVPFWSWVEIQFRSHFNLVRNLVGNPEVQRQVVAAELGKLAAKRAIVASATWSLWGAATFSVFRALSDALGRWLWDCPEGGRDVKPTITMGCTEGGKRIALQAPGALSDIASWAGLDQPAELWRRSMAGEGDLTDVANEMGRAFVNKVYAGLTPVKMSVELLERKQRFPDFFRPGPIRDRLRYTIKGTTGFEGVYDYLRDRPMPTSMMPGLPDVVASGFRVEDTRARAYGRTKGKAAEFLRSMGRDTQFTDFSRQGEAVYYWRQAIREGDERKVRRYYNEMVKEARRTRTNLRAMIQNAYRRAHPLVGMPAKYRREFLDSLTPRERADYENALEYYEETWGSISPRGQARGEDARAAAGT